MDWRGIVIFCCVAGGISTPLLLWRDLDPVSWAASPIPGWLRPLLYGWGPGIAALITLRLRRHQHARTVTFVGTSALRSMLAVTIPIATLGVLAPAKSSPLPHLWGLVVGVHAVTYALGEELGWRGYLHDALRPLGRRRQVVLLGVIWGVWHATSFAGHGSVTEIAARLSVFYLVLIAASAAIGSATDRSHSVLVATACHLFHTLSNILTGPDRWIATGVLAATVFGLVHFWPTDGSEPGAAAPTGRDRRSTAA